MSKSEQDALLAYFNTFKLARRVNTFASLADGKVLMEVSTLSCKPLDSLMVTGHVANVIPVRASSWPIVELIR
jgi:hypothetical protein